MTSDVAIARWRAPDEVDESLRAAITSCWVAVSNSGGAVGFPFPPVTVAHVRPAVDQLVSALDPQRRVLLTASIEGELAGWVTLVRNASPVVSHWATVEHLQSSLAHRGRGVGRMLMGEVRDVARDELGLHHLWLAVRSGMDLEGFYRQLGWVETGRHPAALRLADDDVRDEVYLALMSL